MHNTRCLRDKLDLVFWWLIWLLPLLAAFVCFFGGEGETGAQFVSFMDSFTFSFISDMWLDIEALISITFPAVLRAYASYIVSVEIVHVFVDVMIFIPRICHNIVEVDNYSDLGGFGGKRK